jgi:4'-phosphopantetheinyl transferase
MIKTWLTDIRPLYEADRYEECYMSLPDFRKEKADRLQNQKSKAQSAGAWMLLEKIRKEYGISDEAAFNLSHSGDYVLCSVDMDCCKETKVGCDIEVIKEADLHIAKRFFCHSEYERIIKEKNRIIQSDTFYRFWVLKESFMKATRQGMALDMSSFEIELSNPPILTKQPDIYTQNYYYCEYEVSGVPYKIAVCSTDREIDSNIRMELKA